MTRRWASSRSAGLIALSALNAVLLGFVILQLVSDGGALPDKIEGGLKVPEAIKDVTVRKPFEAYGEILAHPVLFKSRTPFVPPPPAPPPPPPAPPMPVIAVDPGLVVGGVMLKNGLSKAFLFSRAGAVAGTWASEGEEFQGWWVRSIDSSGVKLEQGGRSIRLSLYPVN
jgi:hypothetical protein